MQYILTPQPHQTVYFPSPLSEGRSSLCLTTFSSTPHLADAMNAVQQTYSVAFGLYLKEIVNQITMRYLQCCSCRVSVIPIPSLVYNSYHNQCPQSSSCPILALLLPHSIAEIFILSPFPFKHCGLQYGY